MSSSLRNYNPQRTYDSAARDYDRTSVDFWRFSADRTVDKVALTTGDHVLDVACGPGPVALTAADQVGPTGHVIGLDISEEMLSLARAHAADAGLTNIEFHQQSMDDPLCAENSKDAATCVFGIFFAEDVGHTANLMWSALKPGGRLAITTLGRKFFSPMYEAFITAALRENPSLETDVPWENTADPERLHQMLTEAGIPGVRVEHEVAPLQLRHPDDWWRIVMGTGIKRLTMDLDGPALARVHAANIEFIKRQGIDTLELGVNYATAVKQ
ncbi:class I SAM-dependent methyltransferase [Saccharopolyspora sp. SCSIO 74807]|uniref:class I SAM-dependent methyltransferase n=1 Tax=Saccharopolyspora sp. SCSIO 74807 TaxID=3118084 RepID=UPI0030D4E02D